MEKFKVNEVVLYRNGNRYELGVVKSIVTLSSEKEGEIPYGYRVWYHMGDTTALTHESDLISISNAYAFSIFRKSVEDDVTLNPILQLARHLRKQIVKVVQLPDFNTVGEIEDIIYKGLGGETL